jgi:ATP-dependent Clp protease ATP-binding subunit ClpA
MDQTCELCGKRPAPVFDGRRLLCTPCAQKRTATGALPYLGAALAAAGLIAGSVLLAEKLQGESNERGGSPRDELSRRFRGTPTLGNFSRDLTELARAHKLDPVIGRDDEIERLVSILARRSKNNPVLVGEPGVGKTAIVEG